MFKWFRKIFDRSNDPVYSCRVYKEIGCAHIDGMLCHMGTCGILKKYLEEPKGGDDAN